MKIILLGYMGSGKSTVGKELAKQVGLSFLDLDEEIEKKENLKISEIFSHKGEIYFRKLETAVLSELLKSDENFILSLGGGTPCYGNNMQLVQEATTLSFYLNLSVGNLTERLLSEKAKRPLIASQADEELAEFIGKHLFERNPFYQKANHVINCNGKNLEEVLAAIKLQLI
ncbi:MULTISPECIES: shikimate kinase [Flavobacteriaceae]|uniref:shikimate kinase n=1 Tax=Flavobacteriaceae TaxID=49546 RepID=UPI0010AE47E0|nr:MULTISPECIES: shikimate kinase [Flavobacteriaceae]NJB38007.1 shikimate kinase [Croceivirga sp. JEA036]TKD56541.1 shikimate kinase [Flavobacterium sp. ASW18X]